MNHAQFEERLAIYRDLQGAERARVDEHLRGCVQCAARLKNYQAMDRELANLAPLQPDRGLRERFYTAIGDPVQGKKQTRAQSGRLFGAMSQVGGAVAIIVVIVALWAVFQAMNNSGLNPAGRATPISGPTSTLTTEEVRGRLTASSGQAFDYILSMPANWKGKFVIEQYADQVRFYYLQPTGKIVAPTSGPSLFGISALTQAEWEAEQKGPHGTELLTRDGVVFVENIGLDNPLTGSEAEEFQQMAGQVKDIVRTFTVAPAPPGPPTLPPNAATLAPTPTSVTSVNQAADFPLALGNTWVYQSTDYSGYNVSDIVTTTSTITVTVVDVKTDPSYYAAKIHGDSLDDYWLVLMGDRLYEQQGNLDPASLPVKGQVLIKFPLQLNASWYQAEEMEKLYPNHNNGSMLWQVEQAGSVQVPAGRFADCYYLTETIGGSTFENWFCPGVGFVDKKSDHHGTPFGSHQVLMSYHLKGLVPVSPTLSANALVGGRLAYVVQTPPAKARVDVLDLAGKGSWSLGNPPLTPLGWSPSGQYLLVLESDNQYAVYRYDGTLSGRYGALAQPFWAPLDALPGARDWLALEDSNGSLQAIQFPGGRTREVLTKNLGKQLPDRVIWSRDGWLAWTPNVDELSQAKSRGQPLNIQNMSSGEKKSWRLSEDVRDLYYLPIEWVPDMHLILAGRGLVANSYWSWGVPLVTINADTGEIRDLGVKMLLTREAYDWNPTQPGVLALAVGGSRYLFDEHRLAILDVKNASLQYLTDPGTSAFEPAWFPDGKFLAYAQMPASPNASGDGQTLERTLEGRIIITVDPAKRIFAPLTRPGQAIDGWPHWSADGKYLLYARKHDGVTDVHLVNWDDAQDQILVSGLAAPLCNYGGCGWSSMLEYLALPK